MAELTEFFPSLPIDEWEKTKNTLHLYFQIVGKIRLRLFPKMNHWWHVTLYVSPRGITTRPIPYGSKTFEIEFDFIDHRLLIKCSDGSGRQFDLDNLSVADFYSKLISNLNDLGIEVSIRAYPYDVPFSSTPFAEDDEHSSYEGDYVNRYWTILNRVNSVFEDFRGKFIGKSTPVHLYWHHMDLVVTRFSGKVAPFKNWKTQSDREAYSHEVISVGFWAGDDNVRAPAFYSYTYPEPEGLADQPLKPEKAIWNTSSGSALAILMYDDIRNSENPEMGIMDFLDSAYMAGAMSAGWPIDSFELKTR